jgi:CRP-like cAMP-binding protein/DNA-binding NarL/FixJ family response regulator
MKRARVQIVEDEAIIAADIEEALVGLNYDVVGIAASGKDALELARSKKPDLILMDISIEGPMDGIDTAAEVKRTLDIPVVFLTAVADTLVFNRAKILEPQAYIMKPFRQIELRAAIDLALHKHAQGKQRAAARAATSQTQPIAIPAPNFHLKVRLEAPPSSAMQESARSFLANMPAFKELSPEVLAQVAEVTFYSTLKNFDVFIHEGHRQDRAFLVVAGRAAVFKRSPSGKELVVELIGPGDLFGVLQALDPTDYPFSARSQGESQILSIPIPVIQYLAEYFPAFNHAVLSQALERLRRAHDFSRALAHDRVEVRVASALLALQARFGQPEVNTKSGSSAVGLSLTRMELAELVGTTPETTSRIFANFVEAGALDISTVGTVKVISPEYFEELLRD